MTNFEVSHALECCIAENCPACPLLKNEEGCQGILMKEAYELIDEQRKAFALYGGDEGISEVFEERDRLADENRALRTELTVNSKRKATSDMVSHPPHYESGKYECIDVMEEVYGTEIVKNFCLCNAFKYLYRCMHKYDSPTEDTKKSAWYLEKYFELGDRSNDD